MTSEYDSRKWMTWRRGVTLAVGALAFVCFTVAGFLYPGGGYNPLRQMLSALGEVEVRGVRDPACNWWFMAGMFLSAVSVGMVWALHARNAHGLRRYMIGWGGAINSAGLCTIALVPFDVNGEAHNFGCNLAVAGGAAIIVGTLRCRFAEIAWAVWFAVVVALFAIFLNVDAIPFSPFVTTAQKVLILSFAAWAGWLSLRPHKGTDNFETTT